MGFGRGSQKAAKVAHAWANKLKSEMYERGRETAYRIYFEENTIYSYGRHFPIASLHEKDGVTSVLFTNRRNSPTTNKHIGVTLDACSQYAIIYCYNPLDAISGRHSTNLGYWEMVARTFVDEIPKARNKEARYSAILYNYNQAKIYTDYFGLKLTISNYPKLFASASKEFEAQIKAAHLARKEQERKDNEKRIEAYNQRLSYWREKRTVNMGGRTDMAIDFTDRFPGADPLGFSYFRYNKSTKRIETTQRIELPLLVAKKFLTVICPAICAGEIVTGAKILDYTLLEANKDFIRVGCHKIKVEEIKRQATEMGWEVC
jgi:hypothetical protein